MNDLNLIIIKGVSGSGKSTFANFLRSLLYTDEVVHCEADHFMIENGEYKFDANKLNFAHNQCKNRAKDAMKKNTRVIIVSNTSVKQNSIRPYLDLAKQYNYRVTSLCLENLHGNKNVHNLPELTLQNQETSLRSSLKLR